MAQWPTLLLFLSLPAWGQARRTNPAAAAPPALTAAHTTEPPPQGYMPSGEQTAERVNAARELFAAGRYADAAALLQQVIAVDPKPVHVFNLGQSQRRAGQIDEARASYLRFTQLAPQHPNVPEARNYIRELESIAAHVQRAEQDYRKQLDRTRSDLLQQLNQARDELLTERAQAEAQGRRTPIYKRAWFWGVLGSAVTASVVVGAVVGYVVTRPPDPPPTDTGYINFSF